MELVQIINFYTYTRTHANTLTYTAHTLLNVRSSDSQSYLMLASLNQAHTHSVMAALLQTVRTATYMYIENKLNS